MSDRERYEFPVRRSPYPHWGQADSGGSGAPVDASMVPGAGGSAGETAPSPRGGQVETRPPLKAKATAVKVPGQMGVNQQLEVMSLALGEVKGFLDGLREAGLEGILAQPKAQLQDLKMKRALISMINLVTDSGGLSERAGGLTDEEEATLIKAMLLLS